MKIRSFTIKTKKFLEGVFQGARRGGGLYAAQVAIWRRDLEEQIGRGVEARKRGPKPDPTKEVRHEKDRLERQLAKAKEENRQLRLILAAQKKLRRCSPRRARTTSDPRRPPANRLSDLENAKILETMHEEEFIDQCPREIVPKLADKGIYLGSIRTFYRVLSRHEEVRERR